MGCVQSNDEDEHKAARPQPIQQQPQQQTQGQHNQQQQQQMMMQQQQMGMQGGMMGQQMMMPPMDPCMDPFNPIYYGTPNMMQPVDLMGQPVQYPPFKIPKKVIIIGGGMAGMKLAHTLTKHGIDFCLIEISKYMGGRIKCTFWENETIEEGTNWIKGSKSKKTGKENPIWTMAKACGLKSQVVQDSSICWDSQRPGEDVTEEFDDHWVNLEEKAENLMKKLKRQRFRVQDDLNLKQALADMGWRSGNDNVKKLVEWTIYDGEYANDLDKISTFHNVYEEFANEDFGTDENYVYDKRGFNLIFKQMADELQEISKRYKEGYQQPGTENGPKGIFLNHRVTQINYWNNMVSVVAQNQSTGEAFMFNGDVVVTTASVGVIKAGLMEFNPPLPQWKLDAFNQIEMANWIKIFMVFDTKWWSDENEYIFVANGRKGTYPIFKPIVSDCGQNLMFTYVAGDESRRIERTDPEQIKNEICAHLHTVFQNKYSAEDLRPRAIYITKWDTDPRFMGAYSFLKHGSFQENPVDWRWLPAPVTPPVNPQNPYEQYSFKCPRLWFAGEAYDDKYSGMLAGAYNSGWRTAIDIVRTFKAEDAYEKKQEQDMMRQEAEMQAQMAQMQQQQMDLQNQTYGPYQGMQQQYMDMGFYGNYQQWDNFGNPIM